ncbi:MAG: RHS repeat-associated core domain-containing protein [Phycisphaerae bacterium]|nr:RHS repeat-associated core domain-containing protein [Phycisphaerae bacterium]
MPLESQDESIAEISCQSIVSGGIERVFYLLGKSPGITKINFAIDDLGCTADDGILNGEMPVIVRPKPLQVGPSGQLCPGGATYTVSAFNVRPVVWGFDSGGTGSEGQEICRVYHSNYGLYEYRFRVTSGDQNGTATVKAHDCRFPSISGFAIITIGCADGSCDAGGCGGFGSGKGFVNSLDFRINLGNNSSGESAGHLGINSEVALPWLADPSASIGMLKAYSTLDGFAPSIQELEGVPPDWRQFRTMDGIATVVGNAPVAGEVPYSGYQIQIFSAGQLSAISNWQTTSYYANTGTVEPMITWYVVNPDFPTANNRLKIQKWVDGTVASLLDGTMELEYEFEYLAAGACGASGTAWRMTTSDTVPRERETLCTAIVNGARIETRTIARFQGGQWIATFVESSEYGLFSWGEAVVRRIVDPGGAALVYECDYYDTSDGFDASKHNYRKWERFPDGRWNWYDYAQQFDGSGNLFSQTRVTISPWLDGPPTFPTALPSPNATGVVRTSSVIDPDGLVLDEQTKINNEVVAWTTSSRQIGSSSETVIQRRYASSNGSQPGSEFAETNIEYALYPELEHVLSTEQDDGRFDGWDTDLFGASGNIDGFLTGTAINLQGSGAPDFAANTANGTDRQFIEIHYLNASRDKEAYRTTAEERVVDSGGRELYRKQHVWTGSNWDTTPLTWTKYERDSTNSNRVLKVWRDGVIVQSHSYPGCCDRVTTSMDGTVVSQDLDALGRIVLSTKHAVPAVGDYPARPALSTRYLYEARPQGGKRDLVQLETSGQAPWVQAIREFDLAGRLVSETDQNGYTTTYSYAEGWLGKTVTVTRPDGQTEIASYYMDGQLKSRTGTGVVAEYRSYGVEAGGIRTATTSIGSENSLRFTTTKTDMLDRTLSELRPKFGATSTGEVVVTAYGYYPLDGTYSSGKLKSVDPPDANATIYNYRAWGDVELSGLDVDGSSSLTTASTSDRYSARDSVYFKGPIASVSDSDGWWRIDSTTSFEQVPPSPTVMELRDETYERTALVIAGLPYRERIRIDAANLGPPSGANPPANDTRWILTRTRTTYDTTGHLQTDWTVYSDGSQSTSIAYGGLTHSTVERDASSVVFAYDAFGRRTTSTDSRQATYTSTYFPASTLVAQEVDQDARTTAYTYYPQGSLGAGRRQTVENTFGHVTRISYDARGNEHRTWGDVPQPIEYGYDPTFGERVTMKTWRDTAINFSGTTWPNPSGGDTTTWIFDPATGLLKTKTDAANKSTTYTYWDAGKLKSRSWGRNVTTEYDYLGSTGETWRIDYGDTTQDPDIELSYTRGGRLVFVNDMRTGAEALDVTFGYNVRFEPASEAYTGAFSRTLYRDYQASAISRVGRVYFGDGSEYDVAFEYSNQVGGVPTGRLSRAFGTGLPTGSSGTQFGVHYGYLGGSSLVNSIEYRNQAGAIQLATARAFEQYRPVITSVTNSWIPSATTISKYTYTNDDLSRRNSVKMEGSAFALSGAGGNHWNRYAYNGRNELIDAEQYAGANLQADFGTTPGDPPVNGGFFEYDYDPIGNRVQARAQESPELPTDYSRNSLNQYFSSTLRFEDPENGDVVAANQYTYDADGNLTRIEMSGDSNCDGYVGVGDIGAFQLAITNPAQYAVQYPNCPLTNADTNGSGYVDVGDIGNFISMLTGSITSAPATTWVWDAENRLLQVGPAYGPYNNDKRVKYAYDYRGRRVRRIAETYNESAWTVNSDTRYVWDDWLLLMEIDGNTGNTIRKYTWGLDLAGLNGTANDRTSAGGIGGLLAVVDDDPATSSYSGSYWYGFDANGNVGQLVDADNGAIAVHYEYDPYGNRANPPVAGELEQPMRFSTKAFDAVPGLYYYGYRHYSPRLGRWGSRDPIEELSDIMLYRALSNEPTNLGDAFGLESFSAEEYAALKYSGACPTDCLTWQFDRSLGTGWLPGPIRVVVERVTRRNSFRLGIKYQRCKVCCPNPDVEGYYHTGHVEVLEVFGQGSSRASHERAYSGPTSALELTGKGFGWRDSCTGESGGGGCLQARGCFGVRSTIPPFYDAIGECCLEGKACLRATVSIAPEFGFQGCLVCRISANFGRSTRFGGSKEWRWCTDDLRWSPY